MIEHIAIPSSPLTQAWPCWMMLLFLVIILFCMAHQPDFIRENLHRILSKMDRSYTDKTPDRFANILLVVVRIGMVAMVIDLLIHQEVFSIAHYGIILGVVVAFELVKNLLMRLTHTTFELYKQYSDPFTQYNSLWVMTSIALFPIVLLGINYGINPTLYITTLVIFAIYIILLAIKMIQAYWVKPICTLYIFLYIFTLEILPIVVVATLAPAIQL